MPEDMHDDIAAAMKSLQTKEAPTAPEAAPIDMGDDEPGEAAEAPDESEEATEDKGSRARDEKGKFLKDAPPSKKTVGKGPTVEAKPSAATVPPSPTAAEGQPVAQPTEFDKAPQSLTPMAREKWAQVPLEVRKEIYRREKETAVALQQSAESRKFQDAFKEAIGPFENMIRAEGAEVLPAMKALAQQAYMLRNGNPMMKAQMLAKAIFDFNIPVDQLANALDQLSGGAAPQQSQQGMQQQGAYRDPRVDQLLAEVQQSKQQRAESLRAQQAAKVAEFAKTHEFFEDLQPVISSILQGAAAGGLPMDLESAYNAALQINPEIRQIVKQREEASRAANATASTQRAAVAASGVRSSPAPIVADDDAQGDSLDDDLRSSVKVLMSRKR